MTKNRINEAVNKQYYCSKCGEETDKYGYCPRCRKEYNQWYWAEHSQEHYLYAMLNSDGEYLYIGSTRDSYRIYKHLNAQSHLNMNLEQWQKEGLDKIIYAQVTQIVQDYQERLYIEKLLIEKYNPRLNGSAPISQIQTDRISVLEHDLDFIEFLEFEYKLQAVQAKKNILMFADI